MVGNGRPRTYGGCLPVSLLRISPRGPTVNLPALAFVAARKSGGQLYLLSGQSTMGLLYSPSR